MFSGPCHGRLIETTKAQTSPSHQGESLIVKVRFVILSLVEWVVRADCPSTVPLLTWLAVRTVLGPHPKNAAHSSQNGTGRLQVAYREWQEVDRALRHKLRS